MKQLTATILLVAVSGCSAPGFSSFSVVDRTELAAAVALEVLGGATPQPGPSPAPSGDVCEDCNGLGKVGDGVVMFTCDTCGGTGKKTSSKPEDIPATPEEPEEPEDIPATFSEALESTGPRWTWSGRGLEPPTAFMVEHLRDSHGVDASGLTRNEMQRLHDSLHNGTTSAPASSRSSSCPTGSCPTSSGTHTSSERSLR